MVRFKALLLGGAVAWLWLIAASPASAAPFDIQLVGNPVQIAGGFQWNYAVIIGGGERIQAGATNTVTPQLPSNRSDFFIIYDFLGYIPGTAVGPAGWTATVQDFTPVASRPDLQGGVIDNPAIPNLIFTKDSGANVVGPTTVAGFSANSIHGGFAIGIGSAEFTNNGGLVDNTNNVGSVAVAVPVPEPTTVLLALVGPLFVFGAVKRGLRRRQV
jgi:hypothetical protein